MKLIPTALALALSVNSVHATEYWFEVELILFERHSEKTSQQLHLTPRQFGQHKSIDIIGQQLNPTYVDCPSLSQEQRFELVQERLNLEKQETELSADEPLEKVISQEPGLDATDVELPAEEVIVEPTQCQAPDEALLAQAYQVRQQRIAQQENSVQEDEPEIDDQLTLPQPQPMDEQDIIPVFDPLVFHPYPSTLSLDGVDYEVIHQMPLTTIDQVPVPLIAKALESELTHPHVLPLENLELVELRKKMRWQKSLTPILHTGWRQPVYARHLAKPMHLFGGENFAASYNPDGSQVEVEETPLPLPIDEVNTTEQVEPNVLFNQETPVESLAQQLLDSTDQETELLQQVLPSIELAEIIQELQEPEEPPVPPLWQLDGLLKIYLNRFLFIEADFDLRKPGLAMVPPKQFELPDLDETIRASTAENLPAPDNSISLVASPLVTPPLSHEELIEPGQETLVETPWLQSSQLIQNRRVRSKEIHYFDHPNFGMVIQIRRFKLEVPEQEK